MEVRQTPDGRGMGLYATIHYNPGDKIGNYTGERIDKKELDRRYGKGKADVAEYVVMVGKNSYIDDWMGVCDLSYANDPVNLDAMRSLIAQGIPYRKAYSAATDPKARNSYMTAYRGKAILRASKRIYPGDEIRWNYGAGYWVPH